MQITHDDCIRAVSNMLAAMGAVFEFGGPTITIYPVPRGGVPVAYLLKAANPLIEIVDAPGKADWVVDDIIDSGSTRDDYIGHDFAAMYSNKSASEIATYIEREVRTVAGSFLVTSDWVVFPWENDPTVSDNEDDTIVSTITNRLKRRGARFFANDNIAEHLMPEDVALIQSEAERRVDYLLRGLVIDVDNDHNTKGTARRIASMYINEVFKGRYTRKPNTTSFPNINQLDELYVTGPITLRSACSHHFVPIIGKVWIGIIPGDSLIGLSKFNRLVEWIAARPQIQEELVVQIADAIEKEVQPKGLAVVVKATHMCMTWRGVRESDNAAMTNSVVRGVLRDKPEARAEFYSMIDK